MHEPSLEGLHDGKYTLVLESGFTADHHTSLTYQHRLVLPTYPTRTCSITSTSPMMSRRSSFATCSASRCRLAFRASLVFFQVYCHVAVIFRLGVQSFREGGRYQSMEPDKSGIVLLPLSHAIQPFSLAWSRFCALLCDATPTAVECIESLKKQAWYIRR